MSSRDIPEYRLRHLVQALGDRYGFEAALGRGAFAVVYLVQNLRLERKEAIKVMSESYDGDHEFARRFTSESKLVAGLDHPNIVKVYDYGEVDGILWYSMQYIDGPTLRGELTTRQRFEPLDAARIGVSLLDALEYSHRQGTIHRDIKPSNILLSRRGRPYLMDFGIAKSVRGTAHTMTGSVLGTPAYIAPEQAQSRHLDGRVDVYSLGTTLYELVAGHPPFRGGDMLQVLLRRLDEEPEALSLQRTDVDPVFEEMIHRSLAREPADRFASAGEMRDELLAWIGREGDELRVEITAPAAKPQLLGQATVSSPEDPSEALTLRADKLPKVSPTVGSPSTESLIRRVRRRPLMTVALLLLACLLTFEATRRWFGGSSPGAAVPVEFPAETDAQEEPAPEERAVFAAGEASEAEVGEPKKEEQSTETAPPPPPAPVVQAPPPPAPTPPPPLLRRPVKPPRMLTTPTPEVTGELVTLCAGKRVIISLQVGENGTVEGARVLRSGEPACDERALAAARRSDFEPALDVNDQPVAGSTTIQIQFGEVQTQ